MPDFSATFPLSAISMDSSSPPPFPNPIASLSSFIHHHLSRISADFSRLNADLSTRLAVGRHALATACAPAAAPLAALSMAAQGKHSFDIALSADYVAQTLAGTAVYTVGNANNEFVLISDPNNGAKSLGLLCFRQEDAQSLLAQVQLRQPLLGKGARIVPINLDQGTAGGGIEGFYVKLETVGLLRAILGSRSLVRLQGHDKHLSRCRPITVYLLKVEGIAFRFLPDPLQIKNALELKSADRSRGFDGVPIFQSDLLVIKKKNKRYCPIYFQKEDLERELLKASRGSRGAGLSQHIMVGSLEDVIKKMEVNDKNSGWDDLIFIPPGKSYAQRISEVSA